MQEFNFLWAGADGDGDRQAFPQSIITLKNIQTPQVKISPSFSIFKELCVFSRYSGVQPPVRGAGVFRVLA